MNIGGKKTRDRFLKALVYSDPFLTAKKQKKQKQGNVDVNRFYLGNIRHLLTEILAFLSVEIYKITVLNVFSRMLYHT